jgi:hypothetical protein
MGADHSLKGVLTASLTKNQLNTHKVGQPTDYETRIQSCP